MQAYAEKFNLVCSWIPHPLDFLYFFLWCLYTNVLVLSWVYNTQQVLLMEKQVFHPAQKSWMLRCLKDNQENPSTRTAIPNSKCFFGNTTSLYFFPRLFHTGGLPAYTWISNWLEQSRRNATMWGLAMSSKVLPWNQPHLGTCVFPQQPDNSKVAKESGGPPARAMVPWGSSKHHAEQVEVVLNSVNKPDLWFHANPFSFF